MHNLIRWKVKKLIKRIVQFVLLKFSLYCKYEILKLKSYTPDRDLESHLYLTGMTGSGKSSYLEQLIFAKRYQSRKKENVSIIVLDPHGDTVDKIKKLKLVKHNPRRVVYVDPFFRKGHTPCINPLELENVTNERVELTSQHLVRAFEEMIPDARMSNYMRAILKPCLATLLRIPNTSLSHLQEFMSKNRSERRINEGKNSGISTQKDFFKHEFSNRIYDGTKGSIYTKLQSLLNSEVFHNMTNGISTIDLEKCIRQGKIMLFNLSKGKLGEEVSETIGRFLIARIKSIAIGRAKLPPKMRSKIYLVIDEADSYLGGDSLNVILKETRKYGLHLILCTQNLVSGRDKDKLKKNLLNNTRVKVIGSNGMSTLYPLSKEIGVDIKELIKIRKHEFLIKSGDKKPKKIITSNALGGRSPLLIKSGSTRKVNDMLFKLGYYKPILPPKDNLERIHDLPPNLIPKEISEAAPVPRFNL